MHKKLIWVIIAVLLVARLPMLTEYTPVFWDEASYMNMGKYIYSGGEMGLWEEIRPPLLPFIGGLLWFLGLDIVLAGKLLVLLASLGVIFLTYRLGKRVFSEDIALLAAGIVAFTPVFFRYSTEFLTGIPSTLFALLALQAFFDRKYLITGLFAGLAFTTRFTQGILFAVLLAFHLSEYLGSEKPGFLKDIKQMILGFVPLPLIYLGINWFITGNPIKPLMKALSHGEYSAYAVNPVHGLVFFIIEMAILNIIFLFVFNYFFKVITEEKHIDIRESLIVWLFLLSFVFFTFISNKQIRFVLVFLPYYALLASQGFFWFKKQAKFKYAIPIILLVALSQVVYHDISTYEYYRPEAPPIFEYYHYFEGKAIDGTILVSHPVAAVYVDAKYDKLYGDLDNALELVKKPDIAGVFYQPSFDCEKVNDSKCTRLQNQIFSNLMENKTLVFNRTFYGLPHYIFI
ncbi:MAG: ArnT family glycosyltransferase [Candidatus Nanoarchaeia archaeon]